MKKFTKILTTGIMAMTILVSGFASTSASAATKNKYSMKDIELIAKLVRAEAGGESYKGKVGVAAVIINRQQHKQFPKTVRGVIYQKNQFSPVRSGSINKPADSASRKAAIEASRGSDPTKNAIFFYNPKLVSKTWLKTRKVTTRIGNHTFAK